MFNSTTQSSPITGAESRCARGETTDILFFKEEIGRWGTTDAALDNGLRIGKCYDSDELRLSNAETNRLLAYITSRIWEANRFDEKRPIILPEREISSLPISADFVEANQLWTVEDLWFECKRLSFKTKAVRTLKNLVMSEEEIGDGLKLALLLDPYPGVQADTAVKGAVSHQGLIYSCTKRERLLVLHYLKEEGLIVANGNPLGSTTDIIVTPKGYALVENVQAGESELERKAFMVCRFTKEMEIIFQKCYKDAGKADFLNCSVQRVKDVHHVDKVDDKIIRMIEESTIVIVDLSDDNFNIAFEAGYAMALGKPIVWTKQVSTTEERLHLPFDIQNHNILTYTTDNLEVFIETLQERMKAALDKATNLARNSLSSF